MLNAAAQAGDVDLLYGAIEKDPRVLENIDAIPFVQTPLHVAASAGHVQFGTEIMRLKPSFARKLNQQGYSPIHLAMQQGQKEMVRRFIKINKDLVRVKGREGLTPLHVASQTGEVELLAEFLFTCPESIKDVSVRSETAFHIAVRYQQFEALQVLVGWHQKYPLAGYTELEGIILNWKDEAGNTVLHVSAFMNDTQAVQLLLKTKIKLNAKNMEDSTALDKAGSTEIANKLSKAGAKSGGSVKDAPTLAGEAKSKITYFTTYVNYMRYIRMNMTEDERNAVLVVATLIITATYQSALSPPGGVYQANAGDVTSNTTTSSFNSTANATQLAIAGTSVMPRIEFVAVFATNTLCLFFSIILMVFVIPKRVNFLLIYSLFFLIYSYFFSMLVISPTDARQGISIFVYVLVFVLMSLLLYQFFSLLKYIYGGRSEKREIKSMNNAGEDRW